MSLRIGMQAVVAGSGGAPLPEPRAVSLPGVDEWIELAGWWPAAQVAVPSAGPLTWGASCVLGSNTKVLFSNPSDQAVFAETYALSTPSVRCWARRDATRIRGVQSTAAIAAGVPVRIMATRDGAGGASSTTKIYINGALIGSGLTEAADRSGAASATASIGRWFNTFFYAQVSWCHFMLPAELSAAQVAAADALIAAGDYIGPSSGLLASLTAISAGTRIMPVESTDDLTGGAGSLAIYGAAGATATPFNTTTDDLVAVPT